MRTRSATRARTTFVLTTLVWALAVAALVLLTMKLPQDTAPHRTGVEHHATAG